MRKGRVPGLKVFPDYVKERNHFSKHRQHWIPHKAEIWSSKLRNKQKRSSITKRKNNDHQSPLICTWVNKKFFLSWGCKKQTQRLWEWIYCCQRGRMGEGIVREFGTVMYTLLYLKCTTNQVLLHSTGSSAQCYLTAWMGAGSGGEWIHVYVWLDCFAVHPKLSQHR